MKKCAKCKEIKSINNFCNSARRKGGLNVYCKDCDNRSSRNRYNKNKEKVLLRCKKYRDANPEKEKIRHENYKQANPDKMIIISKNSTKKYNIANPDKRLALNAKRRFDKKQQTLKQIEGQDKEFIDNFYTKSIMLKKLTEIQHHVDHIIPLKGISETGEHIVSGLHVSWNLQILTQRENQVKRSKCDGTYENESWRNDLN